MTEKKNLDPQPGTTLSYIEGIHLFIVVGCVIKDIQTTFLMEDQL